MSAIGWYNGRLGELDAMTVPMNDRAVYFGDGCYEACLAYGTRAFALDAHIDRFYGSLKGLSIPFSADRGALKDVLFRCLDAAGEPCAVLYWQVSRATARRTHAFPEDERTPNLLVTVTPKRLLPQEQPMRLITTEDIRYGMCHLKTLNLIPNVLASARAKEAGADEAVFVRDGLVTEGAHTNIHVIRDGVLCTHPTDEHILAGVTRAILLKLAEHVGIPVAEQAFSKAELFTADEVLVTSSTLGVRRASLVDGTAVGGKAGAICETLQNAYQAFFDGEMA